MPYSHNKELPKSVQGNLPEHAQDIYRNAYNSAFDQYDKPKDREGGATQEETAHKVAWSAVKNSYKKSNNDEWIPR